jgi:hypothetical protein
VKTLNNIQIKERMNTMKYIFSNPEILKELPKLNIKTTVTKKPSKEAIENFNRQLDEIISKQLKKCV